MQRRPHGPAHKSEVITTWPPTEGALQGQLKSRRPSSPGGAASNPTRPRPVEGPEFSGVFQPWCGGMRGKREPPRLSSVRRDIPVPRGSRRWFCSVLWFIPPAWRPPHHGKTPRCMLGSVSKGCRELGPAVPGEVWTSTKGHLVPQTLSPAAPQEWWLTLGGQPERLQVPSLGIISRCVWMFPDTLSI